MTATHVRFDENTVTVEIEDGRVLSVPIAWYPRLSHGTVKERNNWRFTGAGRGIHWPELDEDISVENLLNGKQSGESQKSLKQWLGTRSR